MVTWEQWRSWNNGEYSLLPYVRKLTIPDGGEVLPSVWDAFWAEASDYACLLESSKCGRYTIAGPEPVSVMIGKGQKIQFLENRHGIWRTTHTAEGGQLAQMRDWLERTKAPKMKGVPNCIGGVMGFWSYDMAWHLQKLPSHAEDDLQLPERDGTFLDSLVYAAAFTLDRREREAQPNVPGD